MCAYIDVHILICPLSTDTAATLTRKNHCAGYVLNKPPSLQECAVNQGQFYRAHGRFQGSHFKLLLFLFPIQFFSGSTFVIPEGQRHSLHSISLDRPAYGSLLNNQFFPMDLQHNL